MKNQVKGIDSETIPIKINNRKIEQYVWKLDKPMTLYDLKDEIYELEEELNDLEILDQYSWQFILNYVDKGYRSSKVQNLDDVLETFVLDNLDYTSATLDEFGQEGQFDDEILEITLVKFPKNENIPSNRLQLKK
jgi:hypothetical protein